MIKYVWNLKEEDWNKYKVNQMIDDEYIGNCRTGNICMDIVLRGVDENEKILTYDCYVGGVDSGYGYGIDKYPYDYADGGEFITNNDCTKLSFKQFKKIAEKEFTKFINDNGLLEKAQEPLNLW